MEILRQSVLKLIFWRSLLGAFGELQEHFYESGVSLGVRKPAQAFEPSAGYHAAPVDYHYPGRVILDDFQVVSREEHRLADPPLGSNPPDNEGLRLWVKCSLGFVQNQDLRVVEDGSDERHLLFHPFRK